MSRPSSSALVPRSSSPTQRSSLRRRTWPPTMPITSRAGDSRRGSDDETGRRYNAPVMTNARLNLVLVNPGTRTQIYQSLGERLAAVEPPVWAGLMATYARRRGFSVALLDANAEDLTPEETAERVEELNPLLTAVVVYG